MYKLLIFTALLCSCGHYIHEGEVTNKRYEPGRYYTYTTVIFVGKIPLTQFHRGYDDPDWVVTVHGYYKGDSKVEDFYVDEDIYNCWNIGDHFNDTIYPCSTEDPIEKIK